MSDPYTTPYDVWNRLGRVSDHERTIDTLETGDRLQLEQYVLQEKLVLRDGSGAEIADTDYEIDQDYNEFVYTGSATLNDATLRYKTAPVKYDRAARAVEQAESHVDNHLNTTFGGLKRVEEEVYQTDGGRKTSVMMQYQPVQDVKTVWLNDTLTDQEEPNWVELTEGEDWIQRGNTGIKFTSKIGGSGYDNRYYLLDESSTQFSRSAREVKITYTYGYEELFPDVSNLTEMVLATDMFIDTVFGAGIDGRDDFEPRTLNSYQNKIDSIKEEWTRGYYNNFSTVITPGTQSDVDGGN